MAKGALLKASFTAGELSPRLAGRVDIAKYAGGTKQLRNALPRVQGGARKRPASVYAHALPLQANLAPFIVSNTDAHVIAFVANGAYVYPAQTTPLSSPAVILSLSGQFQGSKFRYAQGGSTMFATWGPDVNPPHRLVRLGANKWIFEAVTWTPSPAEDIGERHLTSISPSATTGSITLTAAASAFRLADVGRFYEDGTGRALITAFTSATVVSATVQQTIAASAASGGWTLTGPPVATCTPSATGPIGASITLTAGANAWKDGTFSASYINAFVEINGGLVEITAVSSATAATGTVRQTLSSTALAPARSWRLLFNPWSQIDGYPSAIALHQQRLYMAGTLSQPQTIWATNLAEYYNFSAGTADDAGFSFELASDQYNPIKHLTSAGELLVFTGGAEFVMRGGVEAPIGPTNVQVKPQSAHGTDDVRPVRIGREVLFAQRHGRRVRAMAYDAATDSFGASDMSVLAEHLMRSNAITCWAYAQTPDSVLWMGRDDGKLVSLSYDRDQDVFAYGLHDIKATQIASMCSVPMSGQDVIFMSVRRGASSWSFERLDDAAYLDSQIDLTMAQQPASYVFGAGTVTVTHPSHGYSTSDSLYFLGWGGGVTNGAYTIAVVDPNTYTISAASTPTATGTVSKAATVWPTGVAHFNSQTVTGFYRDVPGGPWKYLGADYTLAGTNLTLPIAVHELRIGYRITTTIQTLPPEIAGPEGTAQGQAVSVNEVVVRLLDSCGGTVKGAGNAQPLPNPIAADAVAVPWTGDHPLSTMGWGKNVRGGGWDGTITLEHSDPAPFEVLAIIQKLTVNAG